MKLSDLVTVEGRVDLAKSAALIAHLSMAGAFIRMQVIAGDFITELWLTYGGFALIHDGYNRATAMLKDRSDKRIQAQSDTLPMTTVTTTTTAQGPTP